MSSKQDIWMPLFIGDYLRDTTRLTTEKHGAYLLLIMDYWINGAPPDDDEVLSSITKMQLPAWRKTRPALVQLFTVIDGHWRHKRIDEELLKAAENADRYAARAKKAADKRWNKDATSNATSIPKSTAQAMHGDMHADATSPSPSSIKPTEITHSKETNTSVEPTLAASVCLAIKETGILDVNPHNPTLAALLIAGATVDEFKAAAEQVKIRKFSYVLGAVKGMREEAASLVLPKGAIKPKENLAWRNDDNQIVAKAADLGLHTGGKTRFELLAMIDAKRETQRESA